MPTARLSRGWRDHPRLLGIAATTGAARSPFITGIVPRGVARSLRTLQREKQIGNVEVFSIHKDAPIEKTFDAGAGQQ